MAYYQALGLKKEPFSISPDPGFFYRSAAHTAALQRLEIAIRLKRGLSLILGDVGTGKTTLGRVLSQNFNGEKDFEFHLILNPLFQSEFQFLEYLCKVFQVTAPLRSAMDCLEALQDRLYQRGVTEGKTTVLLIDEGQNLGATMIEVLRSLLNFETEVFTPFGGDWSAVSDENGAYSLEGVPAAPVAVEARLGSFWDADPFLIGSTWTMTSGAPPAGGVDVRLFRTARVRGVVYQADGVTPAGSANVRLNAAGNGTGRAGTYEKYAVAAADGSFEFLRVPEGRLVLSAWAGEETIIAGVVQSTWTAEGDLALDVRLGNAAFSPVFQGPDGLELDLEERGELDISKNYGVSTDELIVNESYGGSGLLRLDGRKAETASALQGGLLVTRKIFVAEGGRFVRHFNLLHNPQPVPITAAVQARDGIYPSDADWAVSPASTGRTYAVTARNAPDGEMETVGRVLAGPGDVPMPLRFYQEVDGREDDFYMYHWEAEVPPGQTVAFMTFTVPGAAGDVERVRALTESLSRLEDAEALEGLSPAEKALVANFRISTAPACAPLPSGARGWWRGENDAEDALGGAHGTLMDGAGFAAGKAGQAFSLDGQGDRIVIPDSPVLDVSGPVTVSAWIYLNAVHQTRNKPVLWKGNAQGSDASASYTLSFWTDNKIHFAVADGSQANFAAAASTLLPNRWYHVAGVADGATLKIYIDGVLDGTSPQTVNPYDSPHDLTIGGIGSSAPDNSFNGLIDEPQVYSRALTALELQEMFNAGSAGTCPADCTPLPSGARGWWRGEGNPDDALGGAHGSLVNGAGFAAGKAGQAFSLDGGNDFVSVAHSSTLATSTGVTVEMWFKASSLEANQVLGARTDGSPNGWQFDYTLNGGLNFWIGTSDVWARASASPPSANEWHHVAGVWDGAEIRLFVDGVLAGSAPKTGTINNVPMPLYIGTYNNSQLLTFGGLIDEFTLYGRALTAAEIQAIFQAGGGGRCP